MASKTKRMIAQAVGKRLSGSQPGVMQSIVIAAIVGVAAAVMTYRALRSGG